MINSEPQRELYRKALLSQLESIYPQPCTLADLNMDMQIIGYKSTDAQDVLRECTAMSEGPEPLVKLSRSPINRSIMQVTATEAGCVIARG